MKLQRLALAMAGVGMLAAAAASGPAIAATQGEPTPSWAKAAAGKPSAKAATAVAEPCISSVAWSTAANVMEAVDVTAAKPPRSAQYPPFTFLPTRTSATWYAAANASGTQFYYYGLYLLGGSLYRHTTVLPESGDPKPTSTKIGTGWGNMTTIATSNYSNFAPRHANLYGLNTNGSVYRYVKNGVGYKSFGSFPGFKSFKAMTVISETATYDTLLMTTKAGALYTIRIPLAAGSKPVVKLIRSTGFAAYESLVVQGCGENGGSLVVGVDHDTDAGYQYAFGKAKGTATAITSYGKIPAVFNGLSHVSLTTHYDQLIGE
ncbi:hypothetical protein [Kribbella sp. NPDC051620]|uniref:hypothetical protein n=1 Tax=Kribbella sp. NPDC051620 TaxID=3364120 RepID=UPI0037B3BBB6